MEFAKIIEKICKKTGAVFVIQTVLPFFIPLIIEIPEKYISVEAKVIIVLILAILDLYLIYIINEFNKKDNTEREKNKILRDAYSSVFELNERKRNYIVQCSYDNNIMLSKKDLPYNIHEYITEICNSLKNIIAQITNINKEYVSITFIYRYTYDDATKDDNSWRWVTGKEATMQTSLDEFVNKKNTVYYRLINDDDTFIFYNDKEAMANKNRYFMSSRDERHDRIGSIFGVQLKFSNNANSFAEGIIIVSTYGERFIKDGNADKIRQLKCLIIDDIFPNYQRILETQLGMLYLCHISKKNKKEDSNEKEK